MKLEKNYTSIGGQAVIEGVMMRSPHYIAVALRRADQKIIVRSYRYRSWAERMSWLKAPFLRGVAGMLESMIQGMKTLSFSADLAAQFETSLDSEQVASKSVPSSECLSSFALAASMGSAILLGLGLFVALPHLLAALIASPDSALFHSLDGVIKVLILIGYIFLISRMKEIHRVFQFHGAEHKSIATFEQGEALTVENARLKSPLHPRCGTSFLFFLVLISVFVFGSVFPLLGLTKLSAHFWLNNLGMIVLKMGFMMPIAGISYEVIKLSAKHSANPMFRWMVAPGLLLKRLTTREPDDSQLEIALVSLVQVLTLEKATSAHSENESQTFSDRELTSLSDLVPVSAKLGEFLEA